MLSPLVLSMLRRRNSGGDVPRPYDVPTEEIIIPPPPPEDIPTEDIPTEEIIIPPDDDAELMKKVSNPKRLGAAPVVERPVPEIETPVEVGDVAIPGQDIQIPEDMQAPPEMPDIKGYRDILGSMPNRADFQASTKDKILAAIVGGLTGLRDPIKGIGIARDITERPFRTAMEDFEKRRAGEESALKLDVLSRKPGIDLEKIKANAFAKAQDLRQKWASLKQKEEEATLEFKAKMAGAANDAEKNAITEAHNKVMEGLAAEVNDIRRQAISVDRLMAGARMISAEAYRTHVGQEKEIAGIRSSGSRSPSVLEQTRANNAAVQKVMSENPEWREFLQLAPPGGFDTVQDLDGWLDDTDAPPELRKAIEDETARILQRSYPNAQ